jgi:hypothetical protein
VPTGNGERRAIRRDAWVGDDERAEASHANGTRTPSTLHRPDPDRIEAVAGERPSRRWPAPEPSESDRSEGDDTRPDQTEPPDTARSETGTRPDQTEPSDTARSETGTRPDQTEPSDTDGVEGDDAP